MKIKNINPLERHVEKITLAVATAAAVYLGYTSLHDRVTVPVPGTSRTVEAKEVEQEVGRATQKLSDDMAKAEKNPPTVKPTDYVHIYNDQKSDPVPPRLLAAYPPIGPLQVSASGSPGMEAIKPEPIVTPTIPPPEEVHAVASHGLIIKAKAVAAVVPGAPAVPAAAAGAPAAVDANWVKVEASFPALKLQASFANVDGKAEESLPATAQRITFFRVEVERKERDASGDWGDWKAIEPIQIAQPPKMDQELTTMDALSIQRALDILDQYVITILQPPFYTVVPTTQAPAGGAATRPTVRTMPVSSAEQQQLDRIKAHNDAANRANASRLPPMGGGGSRGGPPGFGPPGFGPPGGMPPYLSPGTGAGAARPVAVPAPVPVAPSAPPGPPQNFAAVAAGVPPWGGGPPPGFGPPGGFPGVPMVVPAADAGRQNQNVQGLMKDASFPIWFWDENVLPEHDYQYRMRVELYNPTFHFGLPLKDPKFLDKPWLASPWVEAAQPVHIEPVQQFFLVTGIGNGSISVKIYQWSLGKIVADEQSISPGLTVGHKPTATNLVDFSTGYTVVDVREKNGDSSVVLLGPTGQLVTRYLRTDTDDPKRKDLDEKSRRALPAPGAGATSGGVVGGGVTGG